MSCHIIRRCRRAHGAGARRDRCLQVNININTLYTYGLYTLRTLSEAISRKHELVKNITTVPT